MPERFPPPPWNFIPEDLDAGSWEQLEPIFQELEQRPMSSAADLEAWIFDVSELQSKLWSEEARRYIGMTCHTDDEERRERYLQFNREIDPKVKVCMDRLDRIFLDSPHRHGLPESFGLFTRFKRSDAEIFRKENVELEAEEAELTTKYTQIVGALTIELDGEEVTFSRAGLELEEPDRDRREAVWRSMRERRDRDRDEIEKIYGELVTLRHRIATNAGFENYRDFRFKKLHRFDYGVEECLDFHDAVEKVVVPCVGKFDALRQEFLGLDSMKPWDQGVNPFSNEPFRPFDGEEELCRLTSGLFAAVEPSFADDFAELGKQDLLDLLSRPNKAPGGYQYFLEDVRMPFIFANAAGTHDDVQTLLHEGGHAFHSLACRAEPLLLYRDPPIEFCEVASIGMEFFGCEHFERVYPGIEARRARGTFLERMLRLLPWIATVDAFQQWVYTNAEASPEERRHAWVRIHSRFVPHTDWSGLEDYRLVDWHRQTHIFQQPFYYIEYGIAIIGALQLWRLSRHDPAAAVAQYRRGLKVGGRQTLAELFDATGLRLDFGAALLGELVGEVFEEWQQFVDEERAAKA